MKKIFILTTFLFFFLLTTHQVIAASVSWDGGASTSNWSDAANWSSDVVPTAADDVTINQNVTINIAASTAINSLTLGQNGGGTTPTLNFSYDAITNGALIIDAGDLTVYSGATITHSAGTTIVVGTVNIDVQTGGAIITGSINTDNKGYGQESGTGAGNGTTSNTCSGGAGHGGSGASGEDHAAGISYGSLTDPITIGSGGGQYSGLYASGVGGGAIKLFAANSISISGTISANGQTSPTSRGGGGSGGSIYLSAPTITGAGSIVANGGGASGCSGAGSGGRIALYYENALDFNGTLLASSGTGTSISIAGSGTIYKKPSGQLGDLILDNQDRFLAKDQYMGSTPLGSISLNNITIQNYAVLNINGSEGTTYNSLTWSNQGIILDNGGTFPLVSAESLTIPETAYFYANTARSYTTVIVNGFLTHTKNSTEPSLYRINLTTTGDFTINSTGSVDLSELGFNMQTGPGAGNYSYNGSAGGGGHGGMGVVGGDVVGGSNTYGSMTAPITVGSGGGMSHSTRPGGRGGGAIQLTVGGTLNLGGSINVNGGNGSGGYNPGGGSGGSVYLTANTISGSANISANGGNGYGNGGGGGGGRVAVYYSSGYTYSGSITINGGTGNGGGQQGTSLVKSFGGELISTPFDTNDPATLIHDLTWTENLPSGTDVKLQIATAPDDGNGNPDTWSAWMGPSGVDTYYTDPSGGEDIYTGHADAADDQWFKYKIILSAAANDVNIPTVSDINITYIINTAPTVAITNTPAESSTGNVTVTYTVSDPEESTVTSYLAADLGLTIGSDYIAGSTSNLTLSNAANLPTSGKILIDNEMISYTGKSGNILTGISRGVNTTTDTTHISGSSVWFVASDSALSGHKGEISTIGTKSITWIPSIDLTNLETTTAKIKILVNDGNLANQIGSDQMSSITLDTKAPVSNDLYLNKYLDQLTLSSTDGNNLYYKASNNADLSADGVNANSGSWIAYTTPLNWVYANDPSTVYVRYKDAYDNETSTLSIESPTRLSSLMIQDASNPDTAEWRLFVSWVTATTPSNGFAYYQVYRSTDGSNYTARIQINDPAQNYLLDTGLDSSTTYYYRTTVVDQHGNESDANYPVQTSGSSSRSGVGLTPDGSGGGDFTAPNISTIELSNVTTTTATLTWNTDELADSTIGYSTDTTYDNVFGSISVDTAHSVTLSNLAPNTKYYYRVMSADALNNKAVAENSSTQFFTTLSDTAGPVISNIKSVVGETSAGITWSTSEAATSKVEYSTDTSYAISSSSASLVLGHALTLSDLSENTLYNYRVISTDVSDNSAISPSYTFTTTSVTTSDTTAPSISDISVNSITATSANITWSTSEAADGKVEYGESTSYERGIAEGNHDYKTTKTVTLIGLSPETTYHYRVTVVDLAGNTNNSSDATFSTGAQSNIDSLSDFGGSSGSNAPSITTAGAAVSDITGSTATISWETNKKSTSEVYYKVKNSLDAPANTGTTTYLTNHQVILSGLNPATSYEYQVKSVDVNGNYTTSAKAEFTTTLPGVTAIKVTNKDAISASISWVTTTPTTTVVEYINTLTRETKKYSNSSLVNNHVADLSNLYPGTVYTFTVLISDEANNLARSDQYSFTTGADSVGPQISGVNNRSTIIAGQNKVQTVITWVTDEPTTSLVEYSLGTGTDNYDQRTLENTDYVQNHIMVISGLKPGSVYRYRVVSNDRSNNRGESEPYVLLTPQKEVSALDIIIQNLQSSFGWINNLTN